MNKILLILTTIFSFNSFAQLNNSDFENWDSISGFITPVGWYTGGYGADSTHDVHQGTAALEVWTWYTYAYGYAHNGGQITSFDYVKGGTPYTQKATSLSGYYKFDTTNVFEPDSAFVVVMLKRYNTSTQQRDTVGLGIGMLPAANVYTPFTVNIIDKMPGINPDSIFVMFASQRRVWDLGNATNTCNPNANDCAYLIIDEVSLSAPAGITELNELFTPLVYPNPAKDFVKFKFSSKLSSPSNLTIFDLNGKPCHKQLISENSNKVNIKFLLKGMYLFTIINDGVLISNGKFIVVE